MPGFDENAAAYDLFERKHHLFDSLTRRQLELIAPLRPKRILDVGCGTGVSSLALYESLSSECDPHIFALDGSESLLARAKERCGNVPGIYFIRGDADNLGSFFHEGFEAIFFTASPFQIPKYRDSIRQAYGLLAQDGAVAFACIEGFFTEDGNNAILKAFPDMKCFFEAAPFHELESCFAELPKFRRTWVDYRFEATRELIFDFLSLPEQSAALFPKFQYLDRIPMIRELSSSLEGKAGPVFMGWRFCIGRKSMRLAS